MGGYVSQYWWGGNPDEVNAITGLSLRDVYTIQRSWAHVYSDPGTHGLLIFIKLFRANPSAQSFFSQIRDMDEDQIKSSAQFKAHALNLMSSLNTAVVNLHQPEVVVALMNKLGDSHRRRKIQTKNFHVLKEVLVDIFTNDLKLDAATIQSWAIFIDFIYKHIFERLEQ